MLYCRACNGPLSPDPPSGPTGEPEDAFRGRDIQGAVLRKRLRVRPDRSIYRASHKKLRRDVRVEVFPIGEREAPPPRLRLLLNRAAVAAGVRSPYVATVLEMGRLSDCCFIITERFERPVQELLDRGEPVAIARALRITEAALRGLAALHRADAVHGVLTPNTILQAPAGAFLLDHPGALRHDSLNRLTLSEGGMVTGPALYVAPERALDERRADIRSDLYSVGALAYHMLSARPPAEGANAQEVMARHVEGTVPPLASSRTDLSPAICSFVDGLLAREPSERPHAPEAALEQLRDCAEESGHLPEGQPAEERETAPLGWTAKWTVVSVLLLAAAIVPFVMMYVKHVRQKAPPPGVHDVLFIVRAKQLAHDPLRPAESRAVGALVRYHFSFCPPLELVEPPGGKPPPDAAALQQTLEETSAGNVLLLTHGKGMQRRNWDARFAHQKGSRWSTRAQCAIPLEAEDWGELEKALGEVLERAVRFLGLTCEAVPGPPIEAPVGEWVSLAEAVEAERHGRWAEALNVLGTGVAPPSRLLRTYYTAVLGAKNAGRPRPAELPPQEGLPPEMNGLAETLRVLRKGEPGPVQEKFGEFLSRFPASARGYYLLGLWRLHALNRPGEASIAFRHAARQNPGYQPAARACARLLVDRNPAELDAFLEEYEEKAPELGRRLREYVQNLSVNTG